MERVRGWSGRCRCLKREGKLKEVDRPFLSRQGRKRGAMEARKKERRNERSAEAENQEGGPSRGGKEINCRGDKCHRDRPLIYYGDRN